METLTWSRGLRGLALVPALLLAACDVAPTDPLGDVDPDGAASEAEAVAAAAVEDSWSELATAEDLCLETLEAAEAVGVAGDAVGPMLDVGAYAAEMEDALAEEKEPLSDGMEGLMEESYLDAALALRGPSLRDEVISGVESALAEVDAALGGRSLPLEAAGRLRAARHALDAARRAADRGHDARALRHAVRAAEALRDLSPRRRAAALVETARRLQARAVGLAGPEPEEEIAAALRLADEPCGRAREALDAGAWRAAVRSALRCGRISQRVIAFLAGGVPDDVLAERAEAIVERAAAFHDRAVELAGPEPGPRIEEALRRAEALLGRAREALPAGERRRAVHLARRSAALSSRVIAYVARGDARDVLSDRISDAVATADALLERVTDLVGDDPDPEIAEGLRRAGELVEEAHDALRTERWRVAFHRARRALGILRGIVVRLA